MRITQQVSHELEIFEVYMKERSETSRGPNKNKALFLSGSSLVFHYGIFSFYDHSSVMRHHTLHQKLHLRFTTDFPRIIHLCLMIIQELFILYTATELSQYTDLKMKTA